MDIGIIGSGHIGSTLAGRLAELGHRVSIVNSRGPASLVALAADIGATAATVKQAARARDIVILAVPEKSVWQLPRDIFATTSAVVVDAGNYYPSRDSRISEIERGLPESAWVARLLGRPVIKAFNNILADSLATRGAPAGTPAYCRDLDINKLEAALAKADAAQVAAYRAQADEAARTYFAADVNDRPPRDLTN